jgi:hypothetical protein
LIVGNDIVDLGDPEAGRESSHPRFDARVFAASELASLAESESKTMMRWILWSAKEAAYKAASRENNEVVFSPVRFVVFLDSELRGFVSHEGRRWPVRVALRGNCVHALVAGEDDADSMLWESQRLTAAELRDPSQSVRKFAKTTIAKRLGLSASDLQIESTGKVPQLLLAKDGRPQALSLSHHGVYAGFACRVPATQGELH